MLIYSKDIDLIFFLGDSETEKPRQVEWKIAENHAYSEYKSIHIINMNREETLKENLKDVD